MESSDPAAVYLARLAPSSRQTMRWALRAIARLLGRPGAAVEWSRLTYAEVISLRAAAAARYRPRTANSILCAARGVLREAWRLGQLDAEGYWRAIDVPPVRGRGAPTGRALEMSEIAALLRSCVLDGSIGGIRDAAIIALLLASGLRRAELVALDLADYVPQSAAVIVREGKGRKARRTYAVTAEWYLQRWLSVRGDEPGPLFLALRDAGHALGTRRLSGEAIRLILRRRAAEAGLRAFTPHDLRRTWISYLLAGGADLASAQELAGHADPRTTAAYDRRGEQARRRAAARVRLPNVGERHGERNGHQDEAGTTPRS